jgi:hypothetical protein
MLQLGKRMCQASCAASARGGRTGAQAKDNWVTPRVERRLQVSSLAEPWPKLFVFSRWHMGSSSESFGPTRRCGMVPVWKIGTSGS